MFLTIDASELVQQETPQRQTLLLELNIEYKHEEEYKFVKRGNLLNGGVDESKVPEQSNNRKKEGTIEGHKSKTKDPVERETMNKEDEESYTE